MSGVFRQSFDDTNNAQETELLGGTDQTKIGNTGDRLKVDASFSSTPTTSEIEIATYVIKATNIAIGNNKSMISILNANGSTRVVKIRSIQIINAQNTAVTGVIADFRLHRIAAGSHSSGTLLTPEIHDLNDILDGNVTWRTGATISGESGTSMYRWKWSSDEWSVGAQDVESNDHARQATSYLYQQVPKTKPITLRADQGLTIKQVTNSTAGSFDISIVYTME